MNTKPPSKCPFHRFTGRLIEIYQALHQATGSPSKTPKREMTSAPVSGMCPLARKSEYYGMLQAHIPQMVAIWNEFRANHPFGLVRFAGTGTPVRPYQIEPTAALIEPPQDFVSAVAAVHSAAVPAVEVYGRIWIDGLPRPRFFRMIELIQDRRKQNFGNDALRQRVTSAFMEVMNLTAGVTELAVELFEREHHRLPTGAELRAIYQKSLAFGLKASDFHLNEARAVDLHYRTPRIKYPKGCSVEGQRTHFNPDLFALEDGCIHMATLEPMGDLSTIDTTDGRSGCPGRAFAKDLWQWWDEMAERWIYPTLPASVDEALRMAASVKLENPAQVATVCA